MAERIYYIGANGSGKTYKLKKVQNDKENSSLFFDENGTLALINARRTVKIHERFYIYSNEKGRGIGADIGNTIEINENIFPIIKDIQIISQRLENMRESPGIRKLKVITSELLTRNLNEIDTIIIDEPENYLDDENMKVLSNLINKLVDSHIGVYYATHSARYLEISKAKLEEIHVLKSIMRKENSFNLNLDQVKTIFEDEASKIEEDEVFKEELGNLMYSKINIKGLPQKLFLESIVYSYEFYMCLFYNEVTLGEGLTEKLLISAISPEMIDNKNFFFVGGKIYIPFFIRLFLNYGKKVRVIFDADTPNGGNGSTPAYRLTQYITNHFGSDNNVHLVVSEGKDLEADFKVNSVFSEFKKQSSLSRKKANDSYFKPYRALFCFYENKLFDDLILKLQPKKENFNFE